MSYKKINFLYYFKSFSFKVYEVGVPSVERNSFPIKGFERDGDSSISIHVFF